MDEQIEITITVGPDRRATHTANISVAEVAFWLDHYKTELHLQLLAAANEPNPT